MREIYFFKKLALTLLNQSIPIYGGKFYHRQYQLPKPVHVCL